MTQQPTHHIPGSPGPVSPDDLYVTPPPWDIGHPQPALRELATAGAIRGWVLDAGCGTGEHALMAAALGLDATGVDLAGTALRTAERKARDRGLAVRFIHHDARHLADLGETFDTVLDCGLFHLFSGADRAADRGAYVDGLHRVLRPGGRYLMLGFSDREPGDWPHKLRRDDISGTFAEGWRIEEIRPSTIETRLDTSLVHAWLATITRL